MMSILSILGFMLVQRHVVCDGELFPVSMFEVDSGENQPIDPQKKDELQPLQGRNVTERSVLPTAKFIKQETYWMKTDIVDKYEFKKHPQYATWTSQPTFQDALETAEFEKAAFRAEIFFLKFASAGPEPWKLIQERVKEPETILYVTAARYLLVTDILWRVSGGKLEACKEKRDSYTDIPLSWEIPKGGVCFPKPYGSATYKSDYDVGLIGKDSGTVTAKFNNYFETVFKMPSELVFDTNVYAFTLEFAMPSMFPSLPSSFIFSLHRLEQMSWYKMQELASAYYKVFKYNNAFFEEMKEEAIKKMGHTGAVRAVEHLQHWLKTFQDMDKQQALRQTDEISPTQFRSAHNNKYQEYLQTMSKYGGYNEQSTEYLAKALLYAAEAYHTRGAIRHVVQGIQMNAITTCQYYTPLSTYDLWVSMIENWGEANKEYQHCGNIRVADCLMKMSKYLSRMFDAMRVIRRTRLPKKDRDGLLDFGSINDPEFAINLLLRYKRSNVKLSQETYFLLGRFLRQFQCKVAPFYRKFPEECMKKIHDAVNAYNKVLAAKVNKINGLKTKLSH